MIMPATEPFPGESASRLHVVGAPSSKALRKAELLALYEHEFRPAARLAYLLCGDTQLADDIAHDAFVRMWERWERVDDPTKRGAYLRATVVNLAKSSHRRAATARKHQGAPALTLVGDARSSEDEALSHMSRPDVMAALNLLPVRQRTVIVLRHWLRMTEGEIAEAMGCSVGSVRTHTARANKALAARLGDLR